MGKKTVKPEDLPYRPCAGVMVLNRDGLVWAGRRIAKHDSEMAGTTHLWQMPQGGIDKGEEPLEAAWRELFEETGIRTATLIAEAPDWITYDLPAEIVGIALKGKYRGQKQRWYAFRFEGDDSEISITPTDPGLEQEFDAWAWKPMHELPGLIVPFKRKVYEDVIAAFSHLAGSRA